MLKKKRFLLIMCAAIFLLSGSVVAFGYGDPYYFILRGTDKEDTVPHAKNDNEQMAYVSTVSTSGFVQGKDVFGCRVRRSSDEAAVTNYRTTAWFNGKLRMPYDQGITGVKGTNYFMRGQIDSTSASKAINISGYWLP